MKSIILIFAIFLYEAHNAISADEKHLSGDALVDYINKNQNLWKAQRNEFLESMPMSVKKKYYGTRRADESTLQKYRKADERINMDIPDSFDARIQWPACTSLSEIRDQSGCGSCWAFGAAEAISDRICITSNGSIQVSISANDILSCCDGDGCNGGESLDAWRYWKENGVVTGSDYVSDIGCRPYPFPPCSHHIEGANPPCPSSLYPTPQCSQHCSESYPVSYTNDKYYGKKFYSVKGEKQIQKDIMMFGPLEADFDVYEDFELYKTGIYKHIKGELIGGHAVKIIGWGVENGTKYWLIANSWNSGWGENGYFRFLRGMNHCKIEEAASAGIPDIKM